MITEQEIINSMGKYQYTTAHLKNKLRYEGFKELNTAKLLYRLKKLEAKNKVKRIKGVYAVMFTWVAT